jgi:hypothetical protein
MPEFLAETYTPCAASDITAVAADHVALAMEQASEETVRFLGAIVVPEDETCIRPRRPMPSELRRPAPD